MRLIDVRRIGLLLAIAVPSLAVATGTAGAIATAVASFLVYNFLFTQPLHTFAIDDPGDWRASSPRWRSSRSARTTSWPRPPPSCTGPSWSASVPSTSSNPEQEVGARVAHILGVPDVLDYLDVGPRFGIARIRVPAAYVGRTLADVDLRGRFGLTPVAIRRGRKVTVIPHLDERLGSSDELIVLGRDDGLDQLGE